MKLSGGRRFYRPRDIAVLTEVRRLMHEEGLSLSQVRDLRRRRGTSKTTAPMQGRATPPRVGDRRARLHTVLVDLLAAREQLSAALRRLL
jgi:DNA-binding transcriptional MerR regulator